MRYGGQANQVQGGLAQQALALGWAEGPPGTPGDPRGPGSPDRAASHGGCKHESAHPSPHNLPGHTNQRRMGACRARHSSHQLHPCPISHPSQTPSLGTKASLLALINVWSLSRYSSGYGGCGGLSMEQAYGGQWPKAEHYPDPYLVPALDPVHASHFQSRSP